MFDGVTPKPTPTSIYFINSPANAVLRRQVAGPTGDGVDGMGYDTGQYQPAEQDGGGGDGADTLSEAGQIYSSLDTNSLATEDINTASASSVATAEPSSSASMSATTSPSPTSTKDAKLAANGDKPDGGVHFHITYLIPVFVLVGLLLLFAVGGKIWGRITYSKERATRRKSRHERQMIREQRREKRERVERIREQWEQNGWGESISPDVSFEKQHPEGGSESEMDESEDELKGPLSAIGTHLAGVRKGRPLPPARRIEQGRYGAKVEANNWWEVQWRRNFGQDDQRGKYNEPSSQLTTPNYNNDTSFRATLRGTWERVKTRITENIGWGYDGNTPDIAQRRDIVANASSHNLWTQVPVERGEFPHMRSGLLLPPQLGEDGYPVVMPMSSSPSRSRKSIFPLTGRQREGSYSPPELRAPPNTIMAVRPSSSRNSGLAGVKDIFTAFRGKSSQSLADEARRGKHERLQSDIHDEPVYPSHSHADGKRCALDEPQHLPPAHRYNASEEEPPLQSRSAILEAPAPLCRSPTKTPASLYRKPTGTEAGQSIRARSASSRMREQGEPERLERAPTSILRNKSSKLSLAMSRSSTVRFTDAVDSSAASFILNYPSAQTPRSEGASEGEEDDEEQASPTRRLSRAKTSAARRQAASEGARRYKSMNSGTLASSLSKTERFEGAERSSLSAARAGSVTSARSQTYTEAVKFGDCEEEDERIERVAFMPTGDSRLLPRTRTLKDGLNRLGPREERQEEGEVVVMDLGRDQSRMPALSSASSTEEDETESERDVESEIDSALLSLIARSNSSKSFYHPFPPIDSPEKKEKAETPTMGTPLGRKKTWRERNGKWQRLGPGEGGEDVEEVEMGTPGRGDRGYAAASSPPPLPTPSSSAWNQQQRSPNRSGQLPTSLAVASRNLASVMSPEDRPFQRGKGELFIKPPSSLADLNRAQRPSPAKDLSLFSPSEYDDDEEVEMEGGGSTVGLPAPSTISAHSTRSTRSQQSSSSSSAASAASQSTTSPQRRIALAKRGSPAKRYQAKLGGGEDEEQGRGSRLHTGKSLRTPAEKDRERQFAMDRVQSIVTKGHARRQQSS